MQSTMVAEGGSDDAGAGADADADARREARGLRVRLVLFLLGALLLVGARPASHHARATMLLRTFSDPDARPDVVEASLTVTVPAGAGAPERQVKARLYSPPGRAAETAPALVLVHGVQYRGIEEPRLQRFARSLVSAGMVVMTPQVDELADYLVAPSSIETVGASIRALRAARAGSGRQKVGLVGTSFGGGIALLTAADTRFADDVAFVVAVGAHDDLARVSRFFATDEIPEVDGSLRSMHAHGYGAMVLAYTHAAEFFPAEDLPAARESLRLWLWEQRDRARESAKQLSPASKARMDRFFDESVASFRPELLAMIERRQRDMGVVSPHDHLAGLRAQVYLLHGKGDSVIPSSETLWLAHDVPPASLGAVLVSPAIVHVELEKPTLGDQWAIVHFMSQVIGAAESS